MGTPTSPPFRSSMSMGMAASSGRAVSRLKASPPPDVHQTQPSMWAIDSAPDLLTTCVHFQGDPVRLGEGVPHLVPPKQRTVADHCNGNGQRAFEQVDGLTQTLIQGRLAVGNKGEIIDGLTPRSQEGYVTSHFLENLLRGIEARRPNPRGSGAAQLTIDTVVSARLGRDLVDPEASSQSPGWTRTKRNRHQFRLPPPIPRPMPPPLPLPVPVPWPLPGPRPIPMPLPWPHPSGGEATLS